MSSSDQLGELSSEGEDLESFKVGEFLSTGLTGVCLADGAFIEGFLDIFLGNDFAEFSTSDSSSDFQDLLGELEPSDGDSLARNSFTIDEDSLVGDDVDDGGELALLRSVVDSGDSSYFDETIVSLSD